ncbi:MAG: glutamate 5-kinase [Limnochordia bacterium]
MGRELGDIRRLVVKVGTSTLTYPTGKLNFRRMEQIVREIADLVNGGYQVLLVTSGAVGAGMGKLGLQKRPQSLPQKQALAAIGQGLLMQVYEKLFGEYGQIVAQVLLTGEDLKNRRRFLNSRNTLHSLLEYGAIPIINENDTVAVSEIRLGDNDTLSALVTGLVDADLLIILSDVDGVYSADPRVDPQATLLKEIKEITPELEAAAGGVGSMLGTGGMATKIEAAKIATASGAALVIAKGDLDGVIGRIVRGEELGTLFPSQRQALMGKKRWIAFYQRVQGQLIIDGGAQEALVHQGKSLLPVGVIDVRGEFEAGDLVSVVDEGGQELARGLTNYGAEQVRAIKGLPSSQLASVLGAKDFDEVIHRDNLVLM